jgi:hypothetical protein
MNFILDTSHTNNDIEEVKMKNKRRKIFIVAILVFSLFLTGVYALLATNLNITGTATGVGDFKIEFSSYNVSNTDKATVTLDDTNTSMNISTNLDFPGDVVTINFVIQNTGSLAATVSNLVSNENSTDDFNIKINGLSSILVNTLAVGETTNGQIVVTWNSTSTNPNPTEVTFDVTIDYVQATT